MKASRKHRTNIMIRDIATTSSRTCHIALCLLGTVNTTAATSLFVVVVVVVVVVVFISIFYWIW